MYPASSIFHEKAMHPNAVTDVMLRFADGTLLTKDDISGLEITYPLNEETELTVGKCVSAELRTTVLNYHGLLSDFSFGQCAVSLGALVSTAAWTMPECRAAVVYNTITFAAHDGAPYLTANGTAANVQPPFAPDCLMILDNVLYAGSEDGAIWAASIGSGGTLTVLGGAATWADLGSMTWQQAADKTWGELMQGNVSAFWAYKLSHWTGRGLRFTDKALYEYSAAGVATWEYVPLGTFYVDTPERRRVATISCTALDGMQKFDADCDNWWAGLTWPLTRGQLLQSLCTWAGVTLETATFPGSTVSIAAAPMAANGLVGKDVLGWIAETACAYARMSRDNRLALVWFSAQDVTLTQGRHFGDSPAEYTTPAVEAVHVMVASSDLGVMVPEGGSGNEYQVIDNPLLYGSTEAEIRGRAQSLYDRLSAFGTYVPNTVEAICDWSIEPGDIIQVVGGDGTTRTMPIFRYSLRWAGGYAKATYECTGGTGRKPAPQSKRREFAAYRAYHKLEVDITGIHSEIGDVKGNVATLEVTASELSTRIEDVEGSYSSITQTVGQLRSEVAGKLDGEDAQTMIDQTVDKISLEVSSDSGGSSFVLKKDGVQISSQTVDLHVKALNVDGEINATAINLSTANISGTLSASYIDVDSLTVKNANIESLYASKIIGGNIGGYLASGAISDAGNLLSDLYVSKADIYELWSPKLHMGSRGSSASTTLTEFSVTTPTGSRTWDSIVAGDSGGAVFG